MAAITLVTETAVVGVILFMAIYAGAWCFTVLFFGFMTTLTGL
jgi:hypothetical protein